DHAGSLRDRRRGGPADAGAQRVPRGRSRGRADRGAQAAPDQVRQRPQRDVLPPRGREHRSHRGPVQGAQARLRRRTIPLPGALACGAGLGGGTIVAALVIVRTLEHHVSAPNYQEGAADPILAGTMAGLAVGATFGWRRSRWLDNLWQRGVIGALSAVGALLL